MAVRTFPPCDYDPAINGRLWRLYRQLRRRFDIPEAPAWAPQHVRRGFRNTAFLAAGANHLVETIARSGSLSAVCDALTLQDAVARTENIYLATFNWLWAAWRQHVGLPTILSGGIEYATPLDAAVGRCKTVLTTFASALAPPGVMAGWQEDFLSLQRRSPYSWDTIRSVFNFDLGAVALQPHPRTIITQAQLDLAGAPVKVVAAAVTPSLTLPGSVPPDSCDGAELADLLPHAQKVAEGIANIVARGRASRGVTAPPGPPEQWQRPAWDKGRRELWFAGVLCRRYAKRAPEQEVILDAFESRKWPARVALPRQWHQRADAVKHLNEGLMPEAPLRFGCDGDGGACWAKCPTSAGKCL